MTIKQIYLVSLTAMALAVATMISQADVVTNELGYPVYETIKWNIEMSVAQPKPLYFYRGETVDMQVQHRLYNQNLAVTNSSTVATFYYQTNGMENAWWEAAATVSSTGLVSARWTPAMDNGASMYTYFFGLSDNNTTSIVYRANGNINMLYSPGFTPNTISYPIEYFDFNVIPHRNAPWVLNQDGAATNLTLRGDVDMANAELVTAPLPLQDNSVATAGWVLNKISNHVLYADTVITEYNDETTTVQLALDDVDNRIDEKTSFVDATNICMSLQSSGLSVYFAGNTASDVAPFRLATTDYNQTTGTVYSTVTTGAAVTNNAYIGSWLTPADLNLPPIQPGVVSVHVVVNVVDGAQNSVFWAEAEIYRFTKAGVYVDEVEEGTPKLLTEGGLDVPMEFEIPVSELVNLDGYRLGIRLKLVSPTIAAGTDTIRVKSEDETLSRVQIPFNVFDINASNIQCTWGGATTNLQGVIDIWYSSVTNFNAFIEALNGEVTP